MLRKITLLAGAAVGLWAMWALISKRRRRKALAFLPWEEVSSGSSVLIVDCTHPTLPCLTHHKMHYAPPHAIKGDSTSDMVLNALEKNHSIVRTADRVSVNHFDIDAFISVWSLLHPDVALQHLHALHAASKIGDFRELDLTAPAADLGLKACCWLNTVERNLFSRPFEPGDKDKWPYFLGEGRFASFLNDSQPFSADWQEEYDRVLRDVRLLETKGHVRRYEDIGLCVIESPEPVHYYALFGQTRGYDIVLTSYHSNSGYYEIEHKYTQFVNLHSRPTLPRINLDRLVKEFNAMEGRGTAGSAQKADLEKPGLQWMCERIVDSGPLMRLDMPDGKLTKAQRYGHPYERPLHRSSLALDTVEDALVALLRHALADAPRRFEWTWTELHAFNESVDWSGWKEALCTRES